MACTLFCAATTPNPDVVLMYLHEAALGADKVRVEDIGVGGKNDARSPAGLRRNPLGELPALQVRLRGAPSCRTTQGGGGGGGDAGV